MSQLLLLSIHQQLEIAFGQILDVLALLIGDDGVHLHKLRGDAHHFMTLLRGGRRLRRRILSFVGRRLLREQGSRNAGAQGANKNKNDWTLKSGHGHTGDDGKIGSHRPFAILRLSLAAAVRRAEMEMTNKNGKWKMKNGYSSKCFRQ